MASRHSKKSFTQPLEALLHDDLQLQVEQLFYELGLEYGLSDSELMCPGDGSEQGTVVYDKFSIHRR